MLTTLVNIILQKVMDYNILGIELVYYESLMEAQFSGCGTLAMTTEEHGSEEAPTPHAILPEPLEPITPIEEGVPDNAEASEPAQEEFNPFLNFI